MTTTHWYVTTTESVQDLPPRHATLAKQGNCLHCDRPRSSRGQRTLHDSALHALICSRRSCAPAKSLLHKALSARAAAGTFVFEVHHHYHADHSFGDTHVTAYASELHAETAQRSWAELPGELSASYLTSQGHARLPTILEEPPYVDASSKPSAHAVKAALSKRG